MQKRFLDDLFMIFNGTTKNLNELFKELNDEHPTLKFTMQHTSPSSESDNTDVTVSEGV